MPNPALYLRTRAWLAPLLLALLVLAVYSNGINASLTYDNRAIILNNPDMKLPTLDAAKDLATHDYWWPRTDSGLYRPITTLSLWFQSAVLGSASSPFAYHLVNIAIHAINACLVYLLARHLGMAKIIALTLASLWAVHPLGTESVTNIVGRADELATLGLLAALILYIRARKTTGSISLICLLAAAKLGIIASLSKESGFILPALALLYEITLNRPTAAKLKRGVLPLAIILFTLAATFLLRQKILGTQDGTIPYGDNPIAYMNPLSAKFTALAVMGENIATAVLPIHLSADYSFRAPHTGPAAYLGLMLFINLLFMAVRAWRDNNPIPLFWLSFFFLTLLPVSNILFPIGTIRADRLMYLPLLGLIGCTLSILVPLLRKSPINPRLLPLLLAALLAALSIRTILRNTDWRTDESLWKAAIRVAPESYRVNMELSGALYIPHTADPAKVPIDLILQYAEMSYLIASDIPEAHRPSNPALNLGILYARKGDLADPQTRPAMYALALDTLLEARRLDDISNRSHRQRMLAKGLPPERIRDVRDPAIYLNLGGAFLKIQQRPSAQEAFATLLQISPERTETHLTLARFHAQSQNWPAATRFIVQALLIDPHDKQAQDLLPLVLQRFAPDALYPTGEVIKSAPALKIAAAEALAFLAQILPKDSLTARTVAQNAPNWPATP